MLRVLDHLLQLRTRRRFRRLRGRTSVSDTRAYNSLCAAAAADPDVFATFKRQPAYTAILEHVSCDLGAAYLKAAIAQTPSLEATLDRFRDNDRLGKPHVCDFGTYGVFSPTTLRSVKVLSDLRTLFGPLDDFRIVEIGVGYGGQCFITHAGGGFRSYALIDLPSVLLLGSRYLEELGVPNVVVDSEGPFDLVLSNYAFSECTRQVQEGYLRELIQPTPRGYMTCNFMDGLNRDELAARLPGARWIEERPLSAKGNEILVWGDKATSHP